jgi:Fe-S cluster assembly iron-binding protein IscA
MLTMTEDAVTVIRTLKDGQALPDDGGVRIANDPAGALTLGFTNGPSAGDQVIENSGARLFVSPEAAVLLDDKALDASVDPEGNVQFALMDQQI